MKIFNALRLGILLSLFVGTASHVSAQEVGDTFESIVYGTNKFTNVRIVKATPVELWEPK